jgi:hypothetical protein
MIEVFKKIILGALIILGGAVLATIMMGGILYALLVQAK